MPLLSLPLLQQKSWFTNVGGDYYATDNVGLDCDKWQEHDHVAEPIPDTDYCINPSWEDELPRAEEETASPTEEEETAWPSDSNISSPTLSPTEEGSAESGSPSEEGEPRHG